MSERLGSIVRSWLGSSVHVLNSRPLAGGWINDVLEIEIDQSPFLAVAKLPKRNDASTDVAPVTDEPLPHFSFSEEAAALTFLRSQTNLRVPEVYFVPDAPPAESFLVLERLPGKTLEFVEASAGDRRSVEEQIADALIDLHAHTSEYFGFFGQKPAPRWIDVFEPLLRTNIDKALRHVTPRTRDLMPALLDAMPSTIECGCRPALVHGDVWAGNILVEGAGDGLKVSGWLDPWLLFADVEYELAYVSVFGTGGDAFFERYHASSPRRPGYETRRLYYWLNTMLVHAWVFGYPRYIERAEELAVELAAALDL